MQGWKWAKQSEKWSPLPSLGKHETSAGTSMWRGREEMVCGKEQWDGVKSLRNLRWVRSGQRLQEVGPKRTGKTLPEEDKSAERWRETLHTRHRGWVGPCHGAGTSSKPAPSSSRRLISLQFGVIWNLSISTSLVWGVFSKLVFWGPSFLGGGGQGISTWDYY